MSAELHGDFFPVEHEGFLLKVWLPHFLCVTHREADVASVLLSFAGEFTFLHICPYFRSIRYSALNYRVFGPRGQGYGVY